MLIRCRRPVWFIAGFVILLYSVANGENITDSAEVEALKDIGAALGKTDWDFSVDPCSGQSGWVTPPVASDIVDDFVANNVTCGICSFESSINQTVCHVTNIRLKAQSLPGTLPPDFSRLPYLQEIDLTRNYLNGTIPPQWSSLPLHSIILMGNRLTGTIPTEFGNISTLQTLYVENNQLSGPLPSELGNLIRMQRLILSSNNFTGELPSSFANFTELIDTRLSDNKFNGTIPTFIQNWTKLTRLDIQASGLQGPIPSIKDLRLLTTLIISDLNGPEAPFPQLNRSCLFQTLILRSCNLTGPLPDYLPQILNSSYLDLSFNKLNGVIPNSYSSLVSKAKVVILAGNMLTGDDWITSEETIVDLSYNNFTTGSSSCQVGKVNLFASSSAVDKSGTVSCLGSLSTCSRTYDSLYINCGGRETTIGSTTYEGDSDEGSAAKFYQSSTNWAYSSTGFFQEAKNPQFPYIFGNSSRLAVNGNPKLYMDARLSPLSLTYYAYCLAKGSYNVSLHFAEILFFTGKNYSSLGRRVFDVHIQGKMVLKDFNIADEAGGFGRAVVKTFISNVNDSTLEIRLFWSGRGTTAIPTRGVYGPLISAISVKSNFDRKSKISAGVIIAIVLSSVLVVSLIVGILWWKRKSVGQKTTMNEDLKTGSFSLRQIKAATDNFDSSNMIGRGGFGSVYKGMLSDGSVIAVKQLSATSEQGNREFVNEIGLISALQHPNLVKLYGCCVEGNQMLLVYEYLKNNSLARALYGPEEFHLELDWRTRHKICVGIAKGLAYLHEESMLKIVHRDIKTTNVLLDANLNPKISDFGLAKLKQDDSSHISTRVAGTFGYMAPEYALRGYLSDKADVYSYGIVVLEIISGRSNNSYNPSQESSFFLLDWAHLLKDKGDLLDLIDPRLGTEFNKDEVLRVINVALLCANVSPSVRPAMSVVVNMLEGKVEFPTLIAESKDDKEDEKKIEAMWKHFKGSGDQEGKRMKPDGPWSGSSISGTDLYPLSWTGTTTTTATKKK